MKFHSFFACILLICLTCNSARAYDNVSFHCESDTTDINSLLRAPELKDMDSNSRVAFFAKKLVGAPSALRSEILDADTLEFTMNIHSFTPLSLISSCIALAKAYEASTSPNWRDFADKYEEIMFKGGHATDFVSRFLYPSDWIADNIFRGNVTDPTLYFEGFEYRKKEKSIDYISSHLESFKAFANQKNYDRLKMLEMGFRNHQIPFISNGNLTNPARYKLQAKEGDIVFLLTPDYNLDSREMGILTWDGDNLMLIQMSPSKENVTLEELPFENYIKRNIKRIQGARIIRIAK